MAASASTGVRPQHVLSASSSRRRAVPEGAQLARGDRDAQADASAPVMALQLERSRPQAIAIELLNS
jgi:hypothetical protein